MSKLTFDTLREANLARLPLSKNAKGGPAHSRADGSDWSRAEWCNAVLGELGELANIIKKEMRGDFGIPSNEADAQLHMMLADELADVATYLDLLAFRCNVDLGAAIVQKWNHVSRRINVGLRLEPGTLGYELVDYSDNEGGAPDSPY